MISDGVPLDRRAALKARHRRAILDAATALISESGTARFTVDQLAERADVARRTIFNHFSSIDDVLTTVSTEVLAVLIENFRRSVTPGPSAGGSRAAMFDEVAGALRATDVPAVVAFLWRVLGGFDAADPRPHQLIQVTFARTAADLTLELAGRHADLDPLEVELLVSSLMHGTEVIANRWIAVTGATTDDAGRAVWDQLLQRLFDNIREGYRPSS